MTTVLRNGTASASTLLCILLGGPRGMADLAQCLGVEKAALTGLMDRVERRDLARRSPVPGDRRALRVILTDTGRETAAAFHAEVSAELGALVSTLSPEDQERFRASVSTINTKCEELDGHAARARL